MQCKLEELNNPIVIFELYILRGILRRYRMEFQKESPSPAGCSLRTRRHVARGNLKEALPESLSDGHASLNTKMCASEIRGLR